jgi:hypothetical protein
MNFVKALKNRVNFIDLIIICLVLLIGLSRVSLNQHGDQALFTLGALNMSQGAILYQDFWDGKPPGIFLFYLVGGKLFGFNHLGIHIFELLYLLAFSVVMMVTLKNYFRNRFVTSLTPLLTVGFYYMVAGAWHLTQVEAIVGFPLFLLLWLLYKYSQSEKKKASWLFLSGLTGGIVVLTKHSFVPIVAILWITAFFYSNIGKKQPISSAVVKFAKFCIPVFFGILIPFLILIGYFAWHDSLKLLLWTLVEYPMVLAERLSDKGIQYVGPAFIDGIKWFFHTFLPLMVLASISAYEIFDRKRRKNLLTLNLLLWIIIGLGVIFLQLRGWQYYYILILFPLGILGARGLDILWSYLKQYGPPATKRKRIIVLLISLMLLFSLVIGTFMVKFSYFIRNGFAIRPEQQAIVSEVSFLSEPESLPGDIYIFGDPSYYLLSGRNQAISWNGWLNQAYTPEIWSDVKRQLTETLPPYIFIDTKFIESFQDRPEIWSFFEKKYHLFRRSDMGIWFMVGGVHDQSN